MAIGAKAIAVREGGVSRLLVIAEMPPEVDEHIDLARTGPVAAMSGALDTLFFGGKRMLRVFGKVGESASEFELIIPDKRLRAAMLVYSRNVALLSLVISLFTATLVYAAIDRVMIRPIRAMTNSMLAFARAPDDPGRIIAPEDRSRRDRRRRARARRHAATPAKDARRTEASGRSRPRSLQDQPRHAQHPRLRAVAERPPARRDATPRSRLSRRSCCARSTARLPIPRAFWPMAARRKRRHHAGR